MRIVHVLAAVDAHNTYGGPVTVALDLAETQMGSPLVSDVTVISGHSARAGRLRWSSPKVRLKTYRALGPLPRMGPGWLLSPGAALNVLWRAMSGSVFHIHGVREPLSLWAALICTIIRRPFIIHAHGMIGPSRHIPILDGLGRYVMRRARLVMALTGDELEAISAMGVKRCAVVTNAVHVARTLPAVAGNDYILFCARLHPRKRLSLFIRAIEVLDAEMGGSPRDVVVIGADEGDGPLVRQWMQRRKNVAWHGGVSIDTARAYISNAAVLVVTAQDEPFGMTLFEAIALRTAVVTTFDVHVARELLEAGAARVTEPDAVQLASAIVEALEDDDSASAEAAAAWLNRSQADKDATSVSVEALR